MVLTCPPGQQDTRMRPVASAGDRFNTCQQQHRMSPTGRCSLCKLPRRSSICMWLVRGVVRGVLPSITFAIKKPNNGLMKYCPK